MRLFSIGFFVFLIISLIPERGYCNIYEYSDENGRVLFYEYTDEKGNSVFTDSLSAIPEQYRKKSKIIKKNPPEVKTDTGKKQVKEKPPAPVAPPKTIVEEKPEEPESKEKTTDWSIYIKIFVAISSLLIVIVFLKILLTHLKRASKGLKDSNLEKERIKSETADVMKKIEKKMAEKDYKGAAEIYKSIDRYDEAAKLYLQTKDFESAAKLFESRGSLEKAAKYYRDAGNFTKAGEIFFELKDYKNAAPMFEQRGFSKKAAEIYENIGDYLKAAELYETSFIREGLGTPGSSGTACALKSGQLFEKTGHLDKAIDIYLKAKLSNEAALLYEKKQDFINAAECYLKSNNLEKAAECFEKGGNARKGSEILSRFYYEKGLVKEAASCAEKSGDLIQAAEMFQEAGDLSKAGELFFKAGYFNEAGESFLRINDLPRAAEAFEKGGDYIQAAKAYNKIGTVSIKVAELFEKGNGFLEAGRLYVKLGQIDNALNALQKVDVHSEDYRNASLIIGMLFLKKGMVKLAFEKFTKIIQDQPVNKSNIEPYYFLALCYEATGDKEKAKSIYDKILIEDYNFRDVKQRVEKLSKEKE